MRQVFTSSRLENVEAVAELLRAEGIEVRITNDRSYRGNRRSNFSYRDGSNSGPQPAVWIINAEDQPRGRQLLRDAGLLESSREGASSYLSMSPLQQDGDGSDARKRKRMRIRLILLGLIGIVAVLIAFTLRKQEAGLPPATAAQPAAKPPRPAIVPHSIDDPQVFRVQVPGALAKMLVEDTLATRKPAQACIAIDGKDPPAAFMASLAADATEVFAASACPGERALAIGVTDYMTDGSGTGTVQLRLAAEAARNLDVSRDGMQWRVQRKP